jgi:zinc transporter 1/2/3
MLTGLNALYLAIIFAVAIAGAYYPFAWPERVRLPGEMRLGEAFSSGVFLALSLTMMLPSSSHIFRHELPDIDYPVASAVAIVAFLVLLAFEHISSQVVSRDEMGIESGRFQAATVVLMTIMIIIPSFFLGATLGISDRSSAFLIFIAIILHKGTAAFALALAMARSTLTRSQSLTLFAIFAVSTPLGIIVGNSIHEYVAGDSVIVKGCALALGAGVFLYMGTMHELKHASLIQNCCTRSGFIALLCGLAITALVRLMVGEAHRL